MKRLALSVLLASLLLSAFADADSAAPVTDPDIARAFVSYAEYKNIAEAAFRDYQEGDFDAAFENISKSARWGDKYAQYMLGLMYVFGDGTEVDFVKGMAWLEVASEAPNRKWRRDLEKLRQEATVEEIKSASDLATRLIDYYGMAANEITCTRRAEIGSNVKEAVCTKRRRPDGVSVRVPADFPL